VFNFIDNYIGLNHLMISSILIVVLLLCLWLSKNKINFKNIIIIIIAFDLIIFNSFLIIDESLNIIDFLPLHLCYLTEIMILFSLLLKSKNFINLIFLNSMVGGLAGLVNTNLTIDMHQIFHIHHYLAHFTLILYTIYKSPFIKLNLKILLSCIFRTGVILIFIILFNLIFGTNYWFTQLKPNGNNLTLIFPESPWHLFVLIFIGLFIYFLTYLKFRVIKNEIK
tara:strand:+ start:388 stop:1059 length:672 start_codon:yes stop_codon:yes gene_type:complete